MHRRGYFFIDAIVALGLLTGVAVTLLVVRAGVARTHQRFGDTRAAVRLAERVLTEAAASAATRPADTAGVTLVDLPDAAPPGRKWMRVCAVVNGQSGEVVGLVRGSR